MMTYRHETTYKGMTIKVLWIGDEQGHYYAEIWYPDSRYVWRETGAADEVAECVQDAKAMIDENPPKPLFNISRL